MPLNSLLELAGRSDLAESLTHSSLFIVCLGVRGNSPHKDITGMFVLFNVYGRAFVIQISKIMACGNYGNAIDQIE